MITQYGIVLEDIREGLRCWPIWSRLGVREVRLRYRRTVLGPLWQTLSLGLLVFALGVIWSELWKMDMRVYLPFMCTGVLAWNLVSGLISDGCGAFVQAERFVKQMGVSYTMLTLAIVWRTFIVFAHNMAVYVPVAIYAGIQPTWASLLLLPALLIIAVNGVWAGLFFATVCSRFRDLQQLVASLMQIALFVTPIFWVPGGLGKGFAGFLDYNFLYHYVDIVRMPLLGKAPAAWSWVVVLIGTILGWAMALALFSRFRKRIAYWL